MEQFLRPMYSANGRRISYQVSSKLLKQNAPGQKSFTRGCDLRVGLPSPSATSLALFQM